jgi:hypothetical protein
VDKTAAPEGAEGEAMRNPKRIGLICRLLDALWRENPDLRLGQLISNLLGPGPHDVFFTEDTEWEKLIVAALRGEYNVGG